MKKLTYTYDELLAVLQTTDDGKDEIKNAQAENIKNRYKSRFLLNYNIAQEEKNKLQKMTSKEYESLRCYQMIQLYSAYYDKNIRNSHLKLLDVRDVNDTSIDSVRRVTGDKAGYIYNNGILALSDDDIQIISNIVKTQADEKVDDPVYRVRPISVYNLANCVDEMNAVIEILRNEVDLDSKKITVNNICMQTNALKRAMGKQEKRNVFYIDDYENCAKYECTSKITLLIIKLKNSVEKFLNPNSKKFDQNRLGNQEIEIDE